MTLRPSGSGGLSGHASAEEQRTDPCLVCTCLYMCMHIQCKLYAHCVLLVVAVSVAMVLNASQLFGEYEAELQHFTAWGEGIYTLPRGNTFASIASASNTRFT